MFTGNYQLTRNRPRNLAATRMSIPYVEGGARSGQALLELTLVTPLLFLLLILAIDFGGWLYSWIQVANATRAAANYAILGPHSAGAPVSPNASAIASLIASDLASLPNYSSTNPVVAVCWNNNGTVFSVTGTCSSPALDPESSSYIAVSVDLTYTYTPLIPSFNIPAFHISLPSLPTTIHRRIVMRFI
jgi:Flp pilus assembly protein TadG